MRDLELLAPARNADIGIAAIDCGADAVYMAGPRFGARQAAGNGIADIARLCTYAHKFGARVFVTLNTILYDDEIGEAERLIRDVVEAGADALIVQDLAVVRLAEGLFRGGLKAIPLHASTQTAILSPEKAEMLSSYGFSRLILERESSLEQIRAIAAAAPECEIEFFVHGALCVCYSGQCYLSEALAGRSANRGACIQACRSRYDLVDGNGKVLVKDKALLSLKDFRLRDRLSDLADAGVCSFKIEGRLKNESYVRNVVRDYSLALDNLVRANPDKYRRASFGRVVRGFTPMLDKTFNRGYTELYIDGRRGKWAAMDAAKGMGEMVGKIISVRKGAAKGSCVIELECAEGCRLSNGDGFAFVAGNGDVTGFRGDVCENLRPGRARIVCRDAGLPYKGAVVFRNFDSVFEKEIARDPGTRMISVGLDVLIAETDGEAGREAAATAGGRWRIAVCARSEDGRIAELEFRTDGDIAENVGRMEGLIRNQLGKTSGIYSFGIESIEYEQIPLLSSSFLNGIRRSIAEELEREPCRMRPLKLRELDCRPAVDAHCKARAASVNVDYRANVANRLAREIYEDGGAQTVAPAYELAHQKGVELMRTRYCIRYELGICPRQAATESGTAGRAGRGCENGTAADSRSLFLVNNGRRFPLLFDCRNCEMAVLG